MRKLSHDELLTRQQSVREDRNPLRFCVVLNNIRSLYNVGSIFRTADGAGLEKLWLCGVTGIPPDAKISKTALGAEKSVPWEYARSARACIENVKRAGYEILFLEQTAASIPYETYEQMCGLYRCTECLLCYTVCPVVKDDLNVKKFCG